MSRATITGLTGVTEAYIRSLETRDLLPISNQTRSLLTALAVKAVSFLPARDSDTSTSIISVLAAAWGPRDGGIEQNTWLVIVDGRVMLTTSSEDSAASITRAGNYFLALPVGAWVAEFKEQLKRENP
jgi:hypothetical protein